MALRPPAHAIPYPTLTKALREFLAWITARQRAAVPPGLRYASTEELVLFSATPIRANLFEMTIPEMSAGDCFDNAYRVSQADPAFRYAEGYALMCGSIPTHHAWLVDRAGEVHDPTWPAQYRAHAARQPERNWSGRVVYMGIEIEAAAHRVWTARRPHPNLLAVRDDDIPEVLRLGVEAFR